MINRAAAFVIGCQKHRGLLVCAVSQFLHPFGFLFFFFFFLREKEGISVPYFLSLKGWSSLNNMCQGADSGAPRIFFFILPLDKCIIMHSPQRARYIVIFPTASKKNPCWAGWRKSLQLIGRVELLTFSQVPKHRDLDQTAGEINQGLGARGRVSSRGKSLIKIPIKPR